MGGHEEPELNPHPGVLRPLRAVPWIVMGTGIVTALILRDGDLASGRPDATSTVLVLLLAAFFLSILIRLVLTACLDRTRRASLLALAAGVCLWAAGSTVLNSAESVAEVSFPAPGEALFLASYAGLAAFLLLDVPRRTTPVTSVWLDAVVVCGGAACLAGFVLLTPPAAALGRDGLPLLIALLYPIIDIVLIVVVVAQVMLRQRGWSVRTAFLLSGLACLTVADSSFVANLSTGRYVASLQLDMLWGCAFALLSGAACARACTPPVVTGGQHPSRRRARTLVAAATIAVAVLVFRPSGSIAWYVTVPAVVTLVAVGVRLALALREAQGASEAVRLSRTDELTGLPNRRALLADLDAGLLAPSPLALMLLDLDGFKDINDSLGHSAGDSVLATIAARMRAELPDDLMVARLGGDEFAVIVRDDDPLSLYEAAARVRDVLLTPVVIDSLELSIRGSVGIAVRCPDDAKAADLLRRADVAMYEAKHTRCGALLYDRAHDGHSRQRLRLAEQLRRAVVEDQLVVWYQPQVDAATGAVTSVEALVRWRHPTEGLLQPIAFLPEARRSGLMLALSSAVIQKVVADASRWADSGFTFRVSFNCAPPELLGGGLLPRLFEAIDNAGLAPDSLLVEVTEDSFLSDPERARETLQELRNHDVQVAIDDYGTGFSSLAYLRDLPVQELKMDRSFVSSILTDRRSWVIVDSTIQMAHAMGLRLVAEGVEDAQVSAELRSMGVDVLQGYHVARPMPARSVAPWVKRWTASHSYDESSRLLAEALGQPGS